MDWTSLGKATFTAIDFETANNDRNSACAVGLVRVERGTIVSRKYRLIRPPSQQFIHTSVHGITYEMVRREPTFAELWPNLVPYFEGVDFVAAHNASFDASVLAKTCAHYGIAQPNVEFRCTLALARKVWRLKPATLAHVAAHLNIPLRHHQADSDAEACARIVLAAREAWSR